ncbi:ubiquitin domain-containing protein UBFD1-like isoform X1 [Rhopilema esculentum]|uniref:ubiquitin domain-containing protein UBFD1-like isoform X1 n=1 Tax=Rhopilema esculentum TaxID=499914 RepID=UPI0031CFE782
MIEGIIMDLEVGKTAEGTVEEELNESENEIGESLKTACDNAENLETIDFRIIWNKQNFRVKFAADRKIEDLKDHITELTGIPTSMQKLMYKGLIKNEHLTLKELNICSGAKLMLVGSTLKDVLNVNLPSKETPKQTEVTQSASQGNESFSNKKEHRKVLDKGKPDDVMPGIIGSKEKLPIQPLYGMCNKHGGKVRLTFKHELDQLWLGTKERTEKIPMSSIKTVISEPVAGNEDYHILGLQLGPTDASRYWIYWVPAQYVDAIKDTILGRWQEF